MNRKFIHSAFSLVLLAGMSACQNSTDGAEDLSSYVNPFIGTSVKADTEQSFNSMGKTFPGAATPFGMTQVSPNTITGGDYGSGYGYQHKTIEGFAFTQMSGIGWYGDLGNFLVMPTTGELQVVAGKESDPEKKGYRSEYDKASEAASAGYYTARLTKYDILTEATASPHGGALRFTYPASDLSRIQIDLARRVGGTSTTQYVEVVNDNTIRGWMKCTPEGGGWGDGYGNPDYTVFFYAEFSKPLDNYGFWSADIPDDWERKRENVLSDNYQARIAQSSIIRGKKSLEGKHVGFFAEFPTTDQEEVTLKAGISFSDLEGAEKNFKAELQGQTFDGMKKQAKELWNKELSKILMEGGTHDEKVAFYTALYHTMIDPRNMTDVDGRYPGGDHQIHQTADFTKRTIFSGWDVFRSQFPLQTIINPTLVNDEINSLVTLAEESGKGYLERWEFFNAYSGCMVGNPAISVLADAYAKNIRKYDIEKAYRAAVRTSELIGNKEELGYTPVEKGYSISETLEYAYTDWCVAQLAKALGKTDDAEKYTRKSLYYKNIFDSEDKMWFRPKRESGAWEEWPANGRLTEWHGSIESNPYQQGWFVPHDIDGMVALMGGEEKVLNDLEDFFEKTPKHFLWNKYYNHSNEPVHQVPFMFNRLNAPWLTQKWTRCICENAYRNDIEGLAGNEDVGQMSAWYILVAAGIHPICPGETRYELTSPAFDKVTFRLEDGKTFSIVAKNNSKKNIYIQRAWLNDKEYNQCFIDHADIAKGGTLTIEMGAEPMKSWGTVTK